MKEIPKYFFSSILLFGHSFNKYLLSSCWALSSAGKIVVKKSDLIQALRETVAWWERQAGRWWFGLQEGFGLAGRKTPPRLGQWGVLAEKLTFKLSREDRKVSLQRERGRPFWILGMAWAWSEFEKRREAYDLFEEIFRDHLL